MSQFIGKMHKMNLWNTHVQIIKIHSHASIINGISTICCHCDPMLKLVYQTLIEGPKKADLV